MAICGVRPDLGCALASTRFRPSAGAEVYGCDHPIHHGTNRISFLGKSMRCEGHFFPKQPLFPELVDARGEVGGAPRSKPTAVLAIDECVGLRTVVIRIGNDHWKPVAKRVQQGSSRSVQVDSICQLTGTTEQAAARRRWRRRT